MLQRYWIVFSTRDRQIWELLRINHYIYNHCKSNGWLQTQPLQPTQPLHLLSTPSPRCVHQISVLYRGSLQILLVEKHALRENCPNTEFFSGSYFPAFGLNTEKYPISARIQSKCGKIRTRKNSVFEHFSCSVHFSRTFLVLFVGE